MMRFSVFLYLMSLATTAFAVDETIEKIITTRLAQLVPDEQVDHIKPTPISGLYEVAIGANIIYLTSDGNYLLKGEILDINGRKNLTEVVKKAIRARLLADIGSDEYIEFSSANDKQDIIYVFTDIDCGYCRKLHLDVPALNAQGVSVRYLAYPRAGLQSKTSQKMQAVWCANDRQQALTAAKRGQSIDIKRCDDPVTKQYDLGRKVGIIGTPAIILENGEQLSGYLPPDELLKVLQN